MSGVFITGTDTGVGKTYVTALIAENLIGKGMDVGVMKPISAGPASENDAVYLKKKLKLKDPVELINPIHLKLPLAPYITASLLRMNININKVFKAFHKLNQTHDLILIEGIGGILVPLTKDYFVADMIKGFNLPTIIVARAGLGTINHTLLTVEALHKRKIKILGIVMNGYCGKELSERSNAEVITKLTGIPILANLPLAG